MKKCALVYFLTVLSLNAVLAGEYAVDEGGAIIAGMGSFSSLGGDLYADSDDNRLTSITLLPSISYFFAPGLGVGAAIEYSRQSQGDNKYHTLGVGPTVSYYIGSSSSKAFPFLAAGFRFYDLGDDDDSIGGTDIVFGGGVLAEVTDNVGLVIEAGYHMMNLKHTDWDESMKGNIFSVSVGVAGLLY